MKSLTQKIEKILRNHQDVFENFDFKGAAESVAALIEAEAEGKMDLYESSLLTELRKSPAESEADCVSRDMRTDKPLSSSKIIPPTEAHYAAANTDVITNHTEATKKEKCPKPIGQRRNKKDEWLTLYCLNDLPCPEHTESSPRKCWCGNAFGDCPALGHRASLLTQPTPHTSQWESELGITKDTLRKTLNVAKLREVIAKLLEDARTEEAEKRLTPDQLKRLMDTGAKNERARILSRLKPHQDYCRFQNGRDDCKNCGFDLTDLIKKIQS